MKKILAFISFTVLLLSFSLTAFASTSLPEKSLPENSEITYLSNGSYIITTFSVIPTDNSVQTAATTYTKQGTKTINCYSSDNELEWEYTLTGTFTVNNGISATCTNATHSKTIYSSKWSFSDENTYAENNVAHGKGVFKRKVLFIVVEKTNVDISITCDVYGNLS
ncbi:MAG: hypothetical protein IJD79_04500 [Clostridia bacterium]|nr:hypothetical protein [Clostridia bacterium]